jgi:hypothetical protein
VSIQNAVQYLVIGGEESDASNKPRYAAALQTSDEKVDETHLFRGDIETLAKREALKLSDLDRDGTGQVNIVMDKYPRRMYVNLCKGSLLLLCVCVVFVFACARADEWLCFVTQSVLASHS